MPRNSNSTLSPKQKAAVLSGTHFFCLSCLEIVRALGHQDRCRPQSPASGVTPSCNVIIYPYLAFFGDLVYRLQVAVWLFRLELSSSYSAVQLALSCLCAARTQEAVLAGACLPCLLHEHLRDGRAFVDPLPADHECFSGLCLPWAFETRELTSHARSTLFEASLCDPTFLAFACRGTGGTALASYILRNFSQGFDYTLNFTRINPDVSSWKPHYFRALALLELTLALASLSRQLLQLLSPILPSPPAVLVLLWSRISVPQALRAMLARAVLSLYPCNRPQPTTSKEWF